LVRLPKGQRVVGWKWIYKKKEGNPDPENARFKACLVAKGYPQKQVVDFNEVFSPISHPTSIRVLLTLVALHDLELEQFDVKTALLHEELEEQIYIQQPKGFIVPRKEDYICHLKKSYMA